MKYTSAVVGGTFDHFHLGHQKLLDIVFSKAQLVTIGISKAPLYQNKILALEIEDYETRASTVQIYLQKKKFLERTTFLPIENIYGPTLQDVNIQAIAATKETLPNISIINKKRHERGFPPLQLITIPDVLGPDGKLISSERIRIGEIDRQGIPYLNLFLKEKLSLPPSLREKLHKPLGKIVANTDAVIKFLPDTTMLIAVGDIIVAKLKEKNNIPDVSVIDFKTRRNELKKPEHIHGITVINEQGTIHINAVLALQNAIKKILKTGGKQTIIVTGEEDLLALPAIVLAPLGSVVLYGQYDKGVVINEVTEELKKKIVALLRQFN